MKRHFLPIMLGILLLTTCILAAVHLHGQSEPPAGGLFIRINGAEQTVFPAELSPEPVTGTLIDGKGSLTEISASGLSVAALFERIGAALPPDTVVRVLAKDRYSAEITLNEPAFLISDGDSLRLVVFGDPDSRRSVRGVVLLEVR